jgi:hypothetical protein
MKRLLKILKEIKASPFKMPVRNYYFGRIAFGTPYFNPWYFNENIITIRKERPKFLRCKWFKLFGREISYGWPVAVHTNGLGWKDKFSSPRFEWAPAFMIFFFKWQFCIWWNAPVAKDKIEDNYWEMFLWWKNYADKKLLIAEATWPWTGAKSKKSTWNRSYLKIDIPCNFDHNGECLECDCWSSDCAWQRYLNEDYRWENKEELEELFKDYGKENKVS